MAQSKRTYVGQEEGKPLVAWLNQHGGEPEGKRIIDLLEKINLVEAGMVTTGHPTKWADRSRKGVDLLFQPGKLRDFDLDGKPMRFVEPSIDLEKIGMEVNRSLECFTFFPAYIPLRLGKVEQFTWSTHIVGGEAILEIVRLGEQGLLGRIRLCARCKKVWLYARFEHQRYCSPDCQYDANYKTDKWRAHRREYLRRHRAKKRQENKLKKGRKRIKEG